MDASLRIDPETSALVLLDFQNFVLDNFMSNDMANNVVSSASEILETARAAGQLVIHVGVRFRPGYPEISPRNRLFTHLKDTGLVDPGGDGEKFHLSLSPRENEAVIVKHRIGAFLDTDLGQILRARGIRTLILAGVTTSGAVLSTVRQAFDLDFDLVVAREACADGDQEVHAFLLEKVISHQATISSISDIRAALSR
jgi:nicotinamidase-related amidase